MTAPAPRRPSPPVLRLTEPTAVLTAVPYLIGFQPTDSLVVLALSGPRGRVGLSLRIDLVPGAEGAVARAAAEHVARDLASCPDPSSRAALVVTYEQGPRPASAPLLVALREELDARDVRLRQSLQVAGDRWWAADPCPDEQCCPPDGTPLVPPGGRGASDAALLAATTLVVEGRAFLPDRRALESLLDPLGGDDDDAGSALLAATDDALPLVVGAEARTVRRWVQRAARRVSLDRDLPPAAVARMAAVLRLPASRDVLLALVLDPEAAQVQQLLVHLARRLRGRDAAMAAAALAWFAWGEGSGALANVASGRALTLDPANTLARLVEQALEAGLPPARLREAVRAADAVLGPAGR